MSHDKLGPHEQRLRELREDRIRKSGGRKLIPYAGADKSVRGGKDSPNTRSTTKGKKT